MGIFDKAKDLAADHLDTVRSGIDKAADAADTRTEGRYGERIDQGAEAAKERLDDYLDRTGPPTAPPPAGA
jgi:hypothetical protein